MKRRIKINWAEMRRQQDWNELFFVEATESLNGWVFSESSTQDNRWFPLPSSPLLEMIAERGKADALEGSFQGEGDLYLKTFDDGISSGLWLGTKSEEPVAAFGAPPASTLLAMAHFRDYCWLEDESTIAESVVQSGPGARLAWRWVARPRSWLSDVRNHLKKEGSSMKWFSDPDELGFAILGVVFSVMAAVLGTVIGGPGLGTLSASIVAVLFATLLKAAHDLY